MKFLHTSDWHVGRTIRNRSRSDEHRAVFTEIVDIAKYEQIDAVLLTGDVFHERRPTLEAQELLVETLAELARQQISSVVIPGNHDDPSLLRALKPLGDLVNVHIISDAGEALDSLVVPLGERGGSECALIGCLPYLHPHQALSTAEGVGTSEDARMSAYQTKLQEYFRALEEHLKRRDKNAIAIVLAHVDIQGSEFGGGEWRSNVFSINGAVLPAHVQYVALGHIHKPQAAPGARAQARYAGSILQMDFGEREQQKSVCIIEAHPGKPASVSQIPLTKGKRLLRRSGTAEALLAQTCDFTDAWVEVVVSRGKGDVSLVEKIGALPAVISMRFEETQLEERGNGETEKWGNGNRSASELFRDYYQRKRKMDPEPQLVALFERLYQEASTAKEGED